MDEKKFDKMKFAQLVSNNPELPIVIKAKSYMYEGTSNAKLFIGKICNGLFGTYAKSDRFMDIARVVRSEFSNEKLENVSFEKAHEMYEQLEWEDAIIIDAELR